jgi:hypothetical protein
MITIVSKSIRPPIVQQNFENFYESTENAFFVLNIAN